MKRRLLYTRRAGWRKENRAELQTRLSMLSKLCSGGQPLSITQLTEGSDLSRQASSKHLRVLEAAGVVRSLRIGREHQYAFEPEPIRDVKKYLERVSDQWDDALARLKAFVERE